MISFLEEHKLLSDHQFRFWHGCFVEDLLSKVVNLVIDWCGNRDVGLTTVIVSR